MAKRQLTKPKAKKKIHDTVLYSFQGGGALGAYQAGVARGLHEANYDPDWILGTSIGAINAAILVGNKPSDRIDKLYDFWDYIATSDIKGPFIESGSLPSRYFQNAFSAWITLFKGQNGFFHLRYPSPLLGLENSVDKISFYDTSMLRTTLERFVDFDRINSKKTRLSLGAVEIATGQMIYFDNIKQHIRPEHIMASCALPPGFPAVEIDGKFFWDGGLSSNKPLRYFIYSDWRGATLCFFVHLFDSYGLLPQTLDEVLKRKKDIEFASQFFKFIDISKDLYSLKYTINELGKLIPESKKDKRVQEMLKRGAEYTLTLVRFLRKSRDTDLSSKDYEFSKKTIMRNLKSGYIDAKRGIEASPWLAPVDTQVGVAVYDMMNLPPG